MFQVKASLSFCPSISMSRRIGTRTSDWVAFSWITAGSWSSKLGETHRTRASDKQLSLCPTLTDRLLLCHRLCCSPQWERPLLVAAQAAAVDGGGAGHGVQVVRAVRQRGNPLAVPLGLLFPGDIPRHMNVTSINLIFVSLRCVLAGSAFLQMVVEVPEVGWWLGGDGDSFVLLIISFQDLLNLRRLQQGHTGGELSVAVI